MKLDPEKFLTLHAAAEAVFRDRGSKFLAYAYPFPDVAGLKPILQTRKKEHPKAVHFCFAYRLGIDGNQFRSADDGEPSGSAGKPILGQIDSAGLTDTLVVVVRYFGGTLLGVPGLINAYKTVAAEALQLAEKEEKWISTKVKITADYQTVGEILHLLRSENAGVLAQDMQLFCTLHCAIPKNNVARCLSQLNSLRGVEATEEK